MICNATFMAGTQQFDLIIWHIWKFELQPCHWCLWRSPGIQCSGIIVVSSRTWTGPFVLSPSICNPCDRGGVVQSVYGTNHQFCVYKLPQVFCVLSCLSLIWRDHDPLIDIGWMILFSSRALQKRHKAWIIHDRMSSVDPHPKQPWSLRRPASYATSSPNGFLSNLVLDLASECLVQELPNLGPVWPVMAFSASFRQPASISCFRLKSLRSQSRMMPATVQ